MQEKNAKSNKYAEILGNALCSQVNFPAGLFLRNIIEFSSSTNQQIDIIIIRIYG